MTKRPCPCHIFVNTCQVENKTKTKYSKQNTDYSSSLSSLSLPITLNHPSSSSLHHNGSNNTYNQLFLFLIINFFLQPCSIHWRGVISIFYKSEKCLDFVKNWCAIFDNRSEEKCSTIVPLHYHKFEYSLGTILGYFRLHFKIKRMEIGCNLKVLQPFGKCYLGPAVLMVIPSVIWAVYWL